MKKLVKCINYIDKLDMNEIKALDLNLGIEIQDFTEPNLKDLEIKRILRDYKKAFEDFHGIRALHGPFLDLKPASPDVLIQEISYKRYLDTLKYAKELDMDYVIFHSQINPYLKEPFLRKLNNTQVKEFWNEITQEMDFEGIIVIENIFEQTPTMLKEYIEEVNLPNIKINLDIGHAKLGEVDLEEWIRELKDHIAYMHIHSNDGIYDKHQSPTVEEIHHLYDLLEKYDIDPVLCLEYTVDDFPKEIKKYD